MKGIQYNTSLVQRMHIWLLKKKKDPIQKDIDRINRNEWSGYTFALLFISVVFLIVGYLLDVNGDVNRSFWNVAAFFNLKKRTAVFGISFSKQTR